jgi:hypothetical protein
MCVCVCVFQFILRINFEYFPSAINQPVFVTETVNVKCVLCETGTVLEMKGNVGVQIAFWCDVATPCN